ncbi:hypothetical protein [Pseudomonas graminis]|nr:hypothetical protein [Pseudomonas graminis]
MPTLLVRDECCIERAEKAEYQKAQRIKQLAKDVKYGIVQPA